jgi:hypothetical protein
MFHTNVACVLSYGCNGFQVFSYVFFKCFKSMFHVFHLPSDICCNCWRRPLPLLSLGRRGPRVERMKCSVVHGRPDMGVHPDVWALALLSGTNIGVPIR